MPVIAAIGAVSAFSGFLGGILGGAEKKDAGKKTSAPSGEKKKRTKARKETYSSYIYKGESNRTVLMTFRWNLF